MNAAQLSAAGQAFHASQFPATITINGQGYSAATSGLRKDGDYDGGHKTKRKTSFWLPVQAFVTAGQPLPEPDQALVCSLPSNLAGNYHIESVKLDPAQVNVVIACSEAPQ